MSYLDIFHTTKDGMRIHVTEMDADHLINFLHLVLVKKPSSALERVVAEARIAPDGMSDRAMHVLGYHKVDDDAIVRIKERALQIHAEMVNDAMATFAPYIILALMREDTHEEAKRLMQSVTGIAGKITHAALPSGDDDDIGF